MSIFNCLAECNLKYFWSSREALTASFKYTPQLSGALCAPVRSRWFLPHLQKSPKWLSNSKHYDGQWVHMFPDWGRSCFPGYHLGYRKHSFMVAGLTPEGPMIINQGSEWYRPLRLLQSLRAGGAAGGQHSHGCFLLMQSTKVQYLVCIHSDLTESVGSF